MSRHQKNTSDYSLFARIRHALNTLYFLVFPSKRALPETESGELMKRALADKSAFDSLTSAWVEEPWARRFIGFAFLSMGFIVGLALGAPLLSVAIAAISYLTIHLVCAAQEQHRWNHAHKFAEQTIALTKQLEASKNLLDNAVTSTSNASVALQEQTKGLTAQAHVLAAQTTAMHEQFEQMNKCFNGLGDKAVVLIEHEHKATDALKTIATHLVAHDEALIVTTDKINQLGHSSQQLTDVIGNLKQSERTFSTVLEQLHLHVIQLSTNIENDRATFSDSASKALDKELDENDILIEELKQRFGVQ
ncbi:MAG TPA: hypothetical protein PK657_10170 [Legionella sp.]|nr:hypothetical protein [Legionella sp.]